MPDTPINRGPAVIATAGCTATMRLTAVPRPEVGAEARSGNPCADNEGNRFAFEMTLNDAATAADADDGNIVFSATGDARLSSLGQTIDLGTTATGLVVSAWPAGVAAIISWSPA